MSRGRRRGCSATSCCARRSPPSRRGRRGTRWPTSWRCCAPTASCTCSDSITPTRTSRPGCPGCRPGCWAPGGPSGRRAGSAWRRTNPGDAMAWLVAAALVLVLLAGLCVATEVAFIRIARAGGRDLTRGRRRRGTGRLPAVLADAPVYLSVLLLVQICCETAATVLVTAALLHWLGSDWQTFLIAVAVMAAVLYLVAGIAPRMLGRQHEGRLAAAAAGVLYPVVRVLGPLPRVLLAVGSAPPPGRRPGLRGGGAGPGGPAGAAPGDRAGRERDDAVGVRAGRDDRARGHGPPHRHGLRRARQDRPAGALAGAAQRLLADSRGRRERGRRDRHRLPQ